MFCFSEVKKPGNIHILKGEVHSKLKVLALQPPHMWRVKPELRSHSKTEVQHLKNNQEKMNK